MTLLMIYPNIFHNKNLYINILIIFIKIELLLQKRLGYTQKNIY